MKKVLLILLFFFAALSVRSEISDISHFFPTWRHFLAPVPPIIINQPANSTTCVGTNATFTVVALNATGYQWQVNQGAGYLNIANGGRYSGANTATLNITGATANMNNYTFRCLVSGDIPAASTPATLTVRQAPVITQNPMPSTICEGDNVLFYIAATNATAYRWQVNTGSGFTDLSDGPGATGGTYVNAHTAVLYITGATVAMSDYYYRCVVTGACTPGATSAAAALTVLPNVTYYEDYDGDGYGNPAATTISCSGAPGGFVSNNQDCDDNNPSLHPGAAEICGDGIDNNCNGQIDEGCSAGITNVTSSNANSTYKIDDIIDIQLIFSAAVNVTGSPSLMLNNGGTATYASGSGTSTLTFSYTVVSGQNSSNLDYSSSSALSFNGGNISNVSGDSPATLTLPAPGSAGSLSANKTIIIDATRPTAGIVVANTSLSFGQTSLITITFSEAVIGFTDSDLMVQNGAISMLNSSDGGRTWTARLTPSPSVTDPSNLITLNNSDVTDENGNAGIGTATSNNYAIDNIRPTAGIVVTNTNLTFGTTSTVTITFNEAVTGFTTDDLTVENGVVSDLSSSDGGTTWTALLTPNNSITDATNVITLDNTGVTDLADNTGTGVTNSNNYEVNTNRPTATIVVADNALSIGETPTVTITFSEAVTGFTNDDLTIANGTLSAVNSTDGGITWKATLTPADEITYLANVITLDNTGVTAVLSGNVGTGVTNSNNYTIDTKRPTATIVVADAALSIGETPTVTITFSEAIIGFTNDDLTIANGTLSPVSSSDGGITWAATFTPTVGITDPTNLITLDNTGVTDLSGNTGAGNTNSNNYAIDTNRPTATIVIADNALSIGETTTVTITFSEAITGFTNDDLTIANGTLSAVSSSDAGITWEATFTPATGITEPTNLITLDNTGLTDLVGNAGTDITNSNNYAIDTNAPNTPTGLTATPGDTEIVLNWTANTETDLAKYRVLAGTSAAPTTILAELVAGTTTYRNTGLNNGTAYYYRIQAIDQSGNISTVSTDISAVPKANQTITFNAITVKTYGEASFTLGNANSSAGLAVTYTAEDASVVSISGNNATILKAGNTMVTASQTGNTSTNAAQNVQQTLTINKATLTVKPDDKEKFATMANPTLTIGYSGFVNNETIAILTSLATASTTAMTTSPIGDYPITAIGASAANYDMHYVAGTLRIKSGAPTNISLAGTTLYENSIAGSNAGTLSSTSDDPDATFTYTLVAGTGDTDNASFVISQNKINTALPLNFENKASYSVRVKSMTQHGLSLEKVLTITLNNVNEAPTLAAISDQSICFTTATQTVALTGISAGPDAGQTTALTVSSSNINIFDALTVNGIGTTGTLSYKVKPGVLAGTAAITLTAKDDGGTANGGIDTYSRTFVITVNPLPVVAVNSDKGTTISKGETVLLTATGGTNYTWANSNGIIGTTNTSALQIRPSQTTTYTVTATNASGCSQTQTITILVNEDFAKVKATNILTPNGDGHNDKWVVDNIDFYPNNEVKIFNKTGRLVYSKKGYDNSWDGTFNGVALNEGTYYYLIDFGNNTRVFKGFITIVRND